MNKINLENITNTGISMEVERLIEFFPLSYLLLNSEGKILHCSFESSDKLFGISPAELIGQSISNFYHMITSADLEKIKEKIKSNEIQWHLKINLLTAEGNSKNFILISRNFEWEGKSYYHCFFLDFNIFVEYIPDVKQQSILLNVFLDYLPDEVYFKDSQLNYIKVNNARAFALGLNSPPEAIGKNDYEFFPDKVAKQIEEEEETLLKNGKTIYKEEKRKDLHSGNFKWFQVTKGILPCPTGKKRGIFAICRDITNQKEAKEKDEFLIKFEKALSQIAGSFLKEGSLNSEKGVNYSIYKMSKLLGSSYSIFLTSTVDGNFIIKHLSINEDFYPNENIIQSLYPKFLKELPNFNSRAFGFKKLMLQYAEDLSEKETRTLIKDEPFFISIIVNNEIYGYLVLGENKLSMEFLEENIFLFNIFSEIISNALENFELEKQRIAVEEEMQKLLRAVEQSANLIIITDNNLNIEYANSTFLEKTGYYMNEIYGLSLNEFLIQEKGEDILAKESFLAKLKQGKNWTGKLKCKTKEKENFWIQLSISSIKNSGGEINNYLAVAEDISEKIVLENQLAIAQKLESIGQLAAGIAHEINSPLQYIGDNTLFAQDSIDNLIKFIQEIQSLLTENNPETKEKLDQIKSKYDIEFLIEELPLALKQTITGIEKVDKIVKAMKNFAHPGNKEKSNYNLNKGIEYAITISKNTWKYVAELNFEPDENLPEVFCQLDEINQVVLNMIINAAQAIEDKLGARPEVKGHINISTFVEEQYAVIKIQDDGCGIPEENLKKIFDPFFTTKEVGRGSGQGLALAYDIIVNKHDGIILVESEVGKGTVFLIKLPLQTGKNND